MLREHEASLQFRGDRPVKLPPNTFLPDSWHRLEIQSEQGVFHWRLTEASASRVVGLYREGALGVLQSAQLLPVWVHLGFAEISFRGSVDAIRMAQKNFIEYSSDFRFGKCLLNFSVPGDFFEFTLISFFGLSKKFTRHLHNDRTTALTFFSGYQ